MKNPFSPANQGEMNLKRNAYDHSRTSLFSTEFGRLDPAFIQEVIPGDSFEIDGSLAIQGMPTVFPLQTRVRASVEFYYSRNRTVFDGFEDFIFRTKDIEQPWLRMSAERAKEMISVGSLGDFFGIPTTYVSDTTISETAVFKKYAPFGHSPAAFRTSRDLASLNVFLANFMSTNTPVLFEGFSDYRANTYLGIGYVFGDFHSVIRNSFVSDVFTASPSVFSLPTKTAFFFIDENDVPLSLAYDCSIDVRALEDSKYQLTYFVDSSFDVASFCVQRLASFGSYRICIFSYKDVEVNPNSYGCELQVPFFPSVLDSSSLVPPSFSNNVVTSGITDATDSSVVNSNPFVGSSPSIKVNALPFRHYEQITNYYYRNDKNNPYVLDGEPQYNEFIPTHAAGADDNVYTFHYRNWEMDRYTSAVQSPQFGEAPLVGLTFSGSDTAVLSFQDAEDASRTYTATVGLDNNRVATIEDFSQDIPSANLRKLQEAISYGISINDLRVTNSFQRFLENVLRRGLRYRNQLKSHFGVGVDYPDIDVPQYIGGYSGELQVGKVTNMAETSEAPLGDFGGSLSGVIQSKHKIRCYCPEHGFIIGIVSITPIPVYTQTCNKVMIKRDPFDYYLPEFGKIGFVPMHYSEVMPLQTPQGGSVNDVFGYQKAWYDYMQSYDEAHGYFRTSLKDFVLQRVFKDRPELVEDFTVIDPDQLSDVFVTTKIEDKYGVKDRFMCNFYNHVIVKRVIPRVGTPSLE